MTSSHPSPRAALGPLSALLLCVACSGARAVSITDVDSGTLPADVATTADLPPAADVPVMFMDVPLPPPVDAPPPPPLDVPPPPPDVPPPVDAGPPTYPAGPYGSAVGRLFRPFTLTACNREGADATWRFDGPDFFTSQLTVINIAAAWSVPCQRESAQLREQIADRYAGQGVRVVQLLVQNVDGSAITPATCRSWVSRYGITFPELMDPAFVSQSFVPMTAFPAHVIVDRCGTIRWRDYGSDSGLTGLRTAIDEVLADPRYPACPAVE